MSSYLTLAQVQYHIDRQDVGALLQFLTKSGLREDHGHIYIPKGFKENTAIKKAIDWLCTENDYSAGERPETIRTP